MKANSRVLGGETNSSKRHTGGEGRPAKRLDLSSAGAASLADRPTPRFAPWQVVALVLLVAVGFRWLVSMSADLGPEDLHRYEQLSGIDLPDVYGELPFFLLWTRGDGQAYATLAADPWLNGPSLRLKVTDIRFTRVGYSLAARTFALGQVSLIPVGLMLANVVALGVYAASTAKLATTRGRRYWWLLGNPALLIGFSGDSAEPLGLALALATLASASTVFAAMGGMVTGTIRPELVSILGASRRPLVGLLGGGFGVLLVQVVAVWRLDSPVSGGMNATYPVVGYLEAMRNLPSADVIVAYLVLTAAIGTVGVGLIFKRGWERFSWVVYGLLMTSLSPHVIHEGFNVVRVSGGLPLLWLSPVAEPIRGLRDWRPSRLLRRPISTDV